MGIIITHTQRWVQLRQITQMSNSDTACMTGVWFSTGAGSFLSAAIDLFVQGWCSGSVKLTDFKMLEALSLWYSTGANSLSIVHILPSTVKFILSCVWTFAFNVNRKWFLLKLLSLKAGAHYLFGSFVILSYIIHYCLAAPPFSEITHYTTTHAWIRSQASQCG